MKKQIRNVAVIAIMASLAAGCQKEMVTSQCEGGRIEPTISNEIKQTVDYSVNGVAYRITLTGDMAWKEFLYNMLDMAEKGNTVRILNDKNTAQIEAAKEVVIYTTADKDEATAWCDEMYANGYSVSISYDSEHNVFVCIAER